MSTDNDMWPEIKTSEQWAKELLEGIRILDADGWDRENYTHSWSVEQINKAEFERRFMLSTVLLPKGVAMADMWSA